MSFPGMVIAPYRIATGGGFTGWFRRRRRRAALVSWFANLQDGREAVPIGSDGVTRTDSAAGTAGHPLSGWRLESAAHDPDVELLRAIYVEFPHSTLAYSRLVHRHWNTVFAACQAILLQDQDAEEATQDTFLKAHRYLPSFRFESRFLTWLRQIARNTALNLYRERRTERLARERVAQDPGLRRWWLPWRSPQPTSRREAIRKALACLDPEDRMIIILHDVEGVPHDEIADAFEMSHGAVRMRAMRARAVLRRQLEPLATMAG